MPVPSRATRRRLLLALASAAAFVVLAEAGLRLAGIPRPFAGLGVPVVIPGLPLDGRDPSVEFDAACLYRLRPGAKLGGRHAILETGFAPPALRLPRAGEGLRVACLGDSCTFGIGARPGEGYASRLSAMLARAFPPTRADVVNAGLPGYSSTQSVALFEQAVAPLRPSIVVAYLGANNETPKVSRLTDREAIERLARFPGRVFASSRLCRLLNIARSPARATWAPDPSYRERVPLADFDANLDRLVGAGKAAGARTAFLVPPLHPVRRTLSPELSGYLDALRRIGAREGLPLLEASEEFRAAEPYPLFAEPIHPGPLGHRILAARLFDLLVTDPRLAAPFDAAGLGGLRAFEALLAEAEVRPISRGEAARAREALGGPGATPQDALAFGLLSLAVDPADAARVPADVPGGAEIALLARALSPAIAPAEAAATAIDPLATAFAELATENLEGASAALRDAVDRRPYRPGLRRLLALVEAARGDAGAATEAGEAARAVRDDVVASDPLEVALAGPAGGPPDLLRAEVVFAAAALLHRDFVLDGNPRVDRRIGRALSAADAGRLDDAREEVLAALATNPREPFALSLLAADHLRRGQAEEAEACLTRAIDADPGGLLAVLARAQVRLARGRPREALDDVGRFLEERPENGDAWLLGADCCHALGDAAEEARFLRGATRHAPDHARVRTPRSARSGR